MDSSKVLTKYIYGLKTIVSQVNISVTYFFSECTNNGNCVGTTTRIITNISSYDSVRETLYNSSIKHETYIFISFIFYSLVYLLSTRIFLF